jgi:hypothetical protein
VGITAITIITDDMAITVVIATMVTTATTATRTTPTDTTVADAAGSIAGQSQLAVPTGGTVTTSALATTESDWLH